MQGIDYEILFHDVCSVYTVYLTGQQIIQAIYILT